MLLLAAALVCTDCHRDLADRFAATPMANSSGPVRPAAEPSGRTGIYRIRDARLEWPSGAVDLTFFIGSRRMGRSYAYSHNGHLYQVPVGYYANRSAWDLAPGYERDPAPDFNRPITAECLFCHATSTTLEPATLNRYRKIVHGIGCARCHGAAAEHEGLRNPARLSGRARDSICEQCHLSGSVRLARAGKRLADFRPGDDLADYIEVFTGGRASGVRVNGHSDALASSRCKQESQGRLWCGTCHNPHNPHKPTASYAAICQSCHAQAHPGDCIACHMPKSKARDGGHTVFTDHSLRPNPPPSGDLHSYYGRQPTGRDLGLAYVQIGLDRRDSRYFEKAWPLLRDAARTKPQDPHLYATIAGLLEASGRRREAAAYYRLSLDQDPLQPDALNKLAALLGDAPEAATLRRRALAILPRPY